MHTLSPIIFYCNPDSLVKAVSTHGTVQSVLTEPYDDQNLFTILFITLLNTYQYFPFIVL